MKYNKTRNETIAYQCQEDRVILFECDRRACEKCNMTCRHTDDIRHAENFQLFNNEFVEKVPPGQKNGKTLRER